ncbi:MAG TPA: DUF805 domain-containing protein [Methylomirabilota bacterium]|nr:DUF805 domain-containing protein [Methylomirabilota bacterium]
MARNLLDVKEVLLSPTGRIGRISFWHAILIYVVGFFLLSPTISVVILIDSPAIVILVLYYTAYFMALLSYTIVCAKRLRDMNIHGYWSVAHLVLVWWVTELFPALSDVVQAVGIVWMLALGTIPGTAGPNRFGLQPKPAASGP